MSEKKEDTPLVSEHEFIPKHELMNEENVQMLLNKYSIKKDQLPKIAHTDPAIKHLGAKRGDVVRILRNSLTAGRTIYYRVVV